MRDGKALSRLKSLRGHLAVKVGGLVSVAFILTLTQMIVVNHLHGWVGAELEAAATVRTETRTLTHYLFELADQMEAFHEVAMAGGLVKTLPPQWKGRLRTVYEAPEVRKIDSDALRQLSRMLVVHSAGPAASAPAAAPIADLRDLVAALQSDIAARLRVLEMEAEEKERSVGRLNRTANMVMIGIGGGALSLFSLLSGSFLLRLSGAMRALYRQTEQISVGNYGDRLEHSRRDEVGALIDAVNDLAGRLEERDDQLRAVQVQFAQQEKLFALGVFAAGVAHEIRNPIQAIMAICDQIAEDLADGLAADSHRFAIDRVDLLIAEAQRLDRIAGRVHDLAAMDVGAVELVDVHETIHRAVELMRFDPRFKRSELVLKLSAAAPVVRVARDGLVQALLNVMINASDAMSGTGNRMTIATRESGGSVTIEVSDTGEGMTEEQIDQAFEPFFTTKPHGEGTGLGLVISRSIVEEAGGAIDLLSERGKGTTLVLTLPLNVEEPACAC